MFRRKRERISAPTGLLDARCIWFMCRFISFWQRRGVWREKSCFVTQGRFQVPTVGESNQLTVPTKIATNPPSTFFKSPWTFFPLGPVKTPRRPPKRLGACMIPSPRWVLQNTKLWWSIIPSRYFSVEGKNPQHQVTPTKFKFFFPVALQCCSCVEALTRWSYLYSKWGMSCLDRKASSSLSGDLLRPPHEKLFIEC